MESRDPDLAGAAYDLLFRRSPRPAYVFDRTSFAFLDVNDAALDLYGYDRDAFLEMTAWEIRPQEEIPRFLQAVREDRLDGRPWRHLHRDGSVVIVEVTSQQVTWAGHDANLVSVQDVTSHEQARQDLASSEERFRLIFDASPFGIVSAGADFRFVEMNPAFCRLLGYPAEQLRGMTFLDVTHPEDRELDMHFARQLFDGEISHYTREKRYVTSSGEVVYVNVTGFVTHDESGKVQYSMGLVEDVTERRRREETAQEEALEAMERLSALTDRECEILERARAKTAREIAEEFTISPRTAESHLASAYRKLRATSRDQALREYDRLLAAVAPRPRTSQPVRNAAP